MQREYNNKIIVKLKCVLTPGSAYGEKSYVEVNR